MVDVQMTAATASAGDDSVGEAECALATEVLAPLCHLCVCLFSALTKSAAVVSLLLVETPEDH